ncbi:MAG TPA: glycosyltransferase family 2 protein [Bacteroidia bacterium]|nr:glycosyltransferase family 2 protein [Bacteroidia bacterium]
MNPKVSICIPAYKQITLLRKVLESIRIQTFMDFELIITDDSPDKAVEVLLNEFDFNNKLKYMHNPVPLGSPANWNYGISIAKGKYIKILHTDDFFISDKSLEKYVELMEKNPQAYFGFSASQVWSIATNEKQTFSCLPKQLERIQTEPDLLFFRNVIGGPSAIIYRRDINMEYDRNLKWLVDIDFYIRVLNHHRSVAYCNESLICTTDGAEGQITQAVINDKQIQIKEYSILFNKLLESGTTIKKSRFSLFFKLLFNKFKVKSFSELASIIPVPAKQEVFYKKIISAVNRKMIFTRILVRLYNSSLNKRIFKMELF